MLLELVKFGQVECLLMLLINQYLNLTAVLIPLMC